MSLNMIFFILIVVYFISGAHSRVMNRLGLTKRDNNLIFIGFFIPGLINACIGLVGGVLAGAGSAFVVYLLIMLLHCFFMYLLYRGL